MKKNKNIIYILYVFILLFLIFIFYNIIMYMRNNIKEKYEEKMNKTIWILWLQGWDKASWLNKKVVESWKNNNKSWNVKLVSLSNLKDYVNDIDYIYDKNKNITHQAKSDIIRLSLLKNHGGVWADATLLCMQPLDNWIYEKIEPADMWMYHGTGGGMDVKDGPASWFIVSKQNSYILEKWKEECDNYWNENNSVTEYFWMDKLFKKLFETDEKFRNLWKKTPYINCEEVGQSHTVIRQGLLSENEDIKKIFNDTPPYVLKLSKDWNDSCGINNPTDEKCLNSITKYAINVSVK